VAPEEVLVVALAQDVEAVPLAVEGHVGECGPRCRNPGGTPHVVRDLLADEAVVRDRVPQGEPIDAVEILLVDEPVGLDAEPGLLVELTPRGEATLEAEADPVDGHRVERHRCRHPLGCAGP
jgi:hypothetical protein